MTECERLIELLIGAPQDFEGNRNVEVIASHLLANGVIVLPAKLGTKVYCIAQPCGGCAAYGKADALELIEQCQKCNRWEVICCDFDYDLIPEYGKTVFSTREEAEQALKERGENA